MAEDSKQDAIKTALTAMEILRGEGVFVEEMKKLLPPFALRQMNQGQEITLEYILNEARLGVENIKAPRTNTAPKPLTYDEVVADLREKDTPEYLLSRAVEKEDIETIKKLIETEKVSAESAIYEIIAANNFNLLKQAVTINADMQLGPYIAFAVEKGYSDITKYLIESGIKTDELKLVEKSLAANDFETAKYLIEEKKINFSKNNAIVAAAQNGRVDVIKYLYASPYGTSSFENSEIDSLNQAALKGHLNVIKYFIKKDPTINVESCIYTAAKQGHLKIIKYFVEEKKTPINVQTLLNCAVFKDRLKATQYIVETLKANVGDNDGSAFLFAAQKGNTTMLEYLLQKNKDNKLDYEEFFWTALDHVNLGFAKLLFDKKNFKLENKFSMKKTIEKAIDQDKLHILEYLGKDLIHKRAIKLDDALFVAVMDKLETLAVWRKTTNTEIPSSLNDKNPKFFYPETFCAAKNMFIKEGYQDSNGVEISSLSHSMAFNTSALFKTEANILKYLQRWGTKSKQPLHDIVHDISVPNKFDNADTWLSAVMQCGPSMAKLVKFADRIEPQKNNAGDAWSYQNTRAAAAKLTYKKAKENIELATLCFDYLLEEHDFNTTLKLTKQSRPDKNLPNITIEGTEFGKPGSKFYLLDKDDVRGLFLGKIVDCCQSLDGKGRECAEHGFTSANGGFYVVTNEKNKIIGETWAWRGKNKELVFDSLETLGENLSDNNWAKLVTAFSKALENKTIKHNVLELTLGMGGATPKFLSSKFNKAASAEPIDYKGYRDSHKQVQVWKAKI